ncbi:hypothetical protein Droror1_Dr00011111 [Drosera rotundifolia]
MASKTEELGFRDLSFGIFGESLRLIFFSRRRFFRNIVLIVAPWFLYIASIHPALLVAYSFINSRNTNYQSTSSSPSLAYFGSITNQLIISCCLAFIIVVSLLFNSLFAFAIASAYTNKDLTSTKEIIVAPKIWKRLNTSILWSLFHVFALTVFFILVVLSCTYFYQDNRLVLEIMVSTNLILYLVGMFYVSVAGQLTSLASAMDDTYGIQASNKSRALTTANTRAVAAVYLLPYVCLMLAQVPWLCPYITTTPGGALAWALGLIIGLMIFSVMVFMFHHFAQMAIYFRSNESTIDASLMDDFRLNQSRAAFIELYQRPVKDNLGIYFIFFYFIFFLFFSHIGVEDPIHLYWLRNIKEE